MPPPWPDPDDYLTAKGPSELLTWSFEVCPTTELPTRISVSAEPSGSGELSLLSVAVSRNTATVTASGGVPGRVYTLMSVTAVNGGRVYQTVRFLPIDPTLAIDPPPVPASEGFGAPIIWGPSFNFTIAANSGYAALLTGI